MTKVKPPRAQARTATGAIRRGGEPKVVNKVTTANVALRIDRKCHSGALIRASRRRGRYITQQVLPSVNVTPRVARNVGYGVILYAASLLFVLVAISITAIISSYVLLTE